jgi:hypothetical protein
MFGRGFKNIITNDLLDYHHYAWSSCFVFSVFPLIQDVAKRSQEKSEKLKAVESGLWELQAKDRRIKEELQKNINLRKELD